MGIQETDPEKIAEKVAIVFQRPIPFSWAKDLVEHLYDNLPGNGHYNIEKRVSFYAKDWKSVRGHENRQISGQIAKIGQPISIDKFLFVGDANNSMMFSGIRFTTGRHDIYHMEPQRLEALVGLWEEVEELAIRYIEWRSSGD